MTAGREKAKPQKQERIETLETEQKPVENQRKEKLSEYLLDVSKYILTGVVITSLFNDVTNKIIIYIIGLTAVFSTLWLGLILTNKGKEK